jgi:hypothetical protein
VIEGGGLCLQGRAASVLCIAGCPTAGGNISRRSVVSLCRDHQSGNEPPIKRSENIIAAIAGRPGRAASDAADSLIDELLDTYASWREGCVAVQEAYENWAGAGRGEEKLAYSAYLAALDREEHAATAYRRCAEQIDRNLPV